MKLKLMDFAPDLDVTIPPSKGAVPAYLTDANWIFSIKGGWRTMPSPEFAPGDPHIPGKCVGCYQYPVTIAGGPVTNGSNIAMATVNGLWVYVVIPSVGGAVRQPIFGLANTINSWSFTSYGMDVLATNGVDPVFVSTNGAPFAPLAGNPPKFSIVEATDFSLFGVVPNSQEYWFTFNDTIWTANIATETGFNFLTSTQGNIVAARKVRNGIAMFKPAALHAGVFVGPPLFWQTPSVSGSVGTWGNNCVVSADDVLYFVGTNDFYSFDGFTLTPLKNNLRQWFFGDGQFGGLGGGMADPAYYSTISGSYDQTRRQVIWAFASTSAVPPGTLDRYISYSILTGAWSTGYFYQGIDIMITQPTPAKFGYVDTTHSLRLLNVEDTTMLGWLTTGPIGDKTNIWRLGRMQPGWLKYPPTPIQPGPANPRLDVYSTYVPGQTDQRSATARWNPATGFFDFVCAGRLQRLRLQLYPAMAISDMDLDVALSGRQ